MTDSDGWARFVAGELVKCPAPYNDRRAEWRPGSDRRISPRVDCGKGFERVSPGYVYLVRVARDMTPGVCGVKKCDRCGTYLQVRIERAEAAA